MASQKLYGVILLCLAFAIIIPSAVMLSQPVAPHVCEEAQTMLAKFQVKVYEWESTWVTYYITIDNPIVKILHYHEGGYVLSTQQNRAETDWQLTVGIEDFPLNTEGDYADVIIKLIAYKNGDTGIAVGALGGWRQQVYFDGTLKVDTASSRWIQWTVS